MVRMRKYLLPGIVCAAIGALVYLLIQREEPTKTHETVKKAEPPPAVAPNFVGTPAVTQTRLDENKWLRELERSLQEGNNAEALFFRQKLCEDIDNVVANGKLAKDLLDTIQKYGINSDDPAQRDVVLPILRVLDLPEATRMISEEYYRAKDEKEQMMLLEAMAKPFHDSKQAAVWAVDKALNSPSAENRETAFDVIKTFVVDDDLIVDTAQQIYQGSTDRRQRAIVLREAASRARESERGREFARTVLSGTPEMDDLWVIVGSITSWGTDQDAARLEQLALEIPGMSDALRDHAREIRRVRKVEAHRGDPRRDAAEDAARAAEDQKKNEEAERKRKEAEGAAGGEPPR
jgi:hypothetical protein